MPFQFLNPWGLMALGSLGGILFLYFYVFHGHRREVSALFLWQSKRSLREEGRKQDRPPITLPLILELMAALLLSLIIAGLAYQHKRLRPHVVVLVDASASMNASHSGTDFTERATRLVQDIGREMGADVQVTLMESFKNRLLAQEASIDEAAGRLSDWEPSAPPHGFHQAGQIARSLYSSDDDVVFITDQKRTLPGLKVASVGKKLSNTGWTAGRWRENDEVFVRLTQFGPGEQDKKVIIQDSTGKVIAEKEVPVSGPESVPLTFSVPQDVESVTLLLPEDALKNDNKLVLTRPAREAIPVAIDVENERVDEHLRKALQAAGSVAMQQDGNVALLCCDKPQKQRKALLTLRFHMTSAEEATTVTGPYFVNAYESVTRGLELKGTIWSADEGYQPDGVQELVTAGDIPLLTTTSDEIVMNLAASGTNIFRRTTWPILISNIVDETRRRMPGIKRYLYRIGETLRFRRPFGWSGSTVIRTPEGREISFEGADIYYGTLEKEGIYTIYMEEDPEQSRKIAVNLLSEDESDLTQAGEYIPENIVGGGRRKTTKVDTLAPLLAILAALCLCGSWFCLERRSKIFG